MVVLSVGMEIPKENLELAERLGLSLTEGKFCATLPFTPVNTSKDGVYVCGVFQGPKDIPQSVTEASAAACAAAMDLGKARWTQTKTKETPKELDVSSLEPRIGVFVCNCGTNIGGIINVPGVATYAATLPRVVHVEESLFTCAQDSQDHMKAVIQEHNLNRVVVAACSPRTHEPLFQERSRPAGSTSSFLRWPTSATRIPGFTARIRPLPRTRPKTSLGWRSPGWPCSSPSQANESPLTNGPW